MLESTARSLVRRNRVACSNGPAARYVVARHRWWLSIGIGLCLAASGGAWSSPCRADDEVPSIVGYGLEGLGTGAGVGLAVGYLATGRDFDSSEWRTLAWGTAIGALSGLGVGLLLGTVEAATTHQRGIAFYMIRDSNYGVAVGFLAGGIIGSLIWLSDGSGRDLLRGMAWGTIIGAASGALIGLVEAVLRSPSSTPNVEHATRAGTIRLGFGVTTTSAGAPIPYPTLSGRF